MKVLHSDKSVVVSAPTGSGKTVILELAIIRFLANTEVGNNSMKIIYCESRTQLYKCKV